jgi:hypothetical protein
MTVAAEDLAAAGVVAADLLREALRAAETPGVRVLGVTTEGGTG